MFSKRSSEWSVKSRSSLTWIDTLKTGIVPKRADNAIFKLTLGKIQPAPS